MAAYSADSRSHSFSLIEIEKAWYLVSLLLRLGRPVRPTELAARCSLFIASPDLVELLCSIPGSPLYLTEDLFVTISLEVVLSAFSEFASKAIASFVPRICLRVSWPKRLWDGSVQTYVRKRKHLRFDSFLLPTAKRRLLSHSENEVDDHHLLPLANGIQIASSKASNNVGDDMSRDVGFLPFDVSVMEHASGIFKQESAVPRLLIASDSVLSSYRLGDFDHKGVNETEMKCNDTRSIITYRESLEYLHLAEYQCNFLNSEIDLNQKVMTDENPRGSERDGRPAHLTGTMQRQILWNHIQGDENYSQTTGCLEAYNHYCCSTTGKGVHENLYCHSARSGMKDAGTTEFHCSIARERDFLDTGTLRGDPESCVPHDNTAQIGEVLKIETTLENKMKCADNMTTLFTDQTAAEVEIPVLNSLPAEPCTAQKLAESCVPHDNIAQIGELLKTEITLENQMKCANNMTTLLTNQTAAEVEIPVNSLPAEPCTAQKLPTNSFSNRKPLQREALTLELQVFSKPLDDNKLVDPSKQREQDKKDEKCIFKRQQSKRGRNHNVPTKEHRADSMPKANKNLLEPKALPNFDSFIVEEEEGSGGYGTVYRARRRNDGKTFAVKCPHANAHTRHANNELKMLERFGGRNFVINYEGSFKSGNSDCFVLEHVEHDRPEVLKREIDASELQWYGYCMFRALASLHKQGIVHRDVKPGNFLFSRKRCKGYLIDFNLAMDLNHKYCTNSYSKMNSTGSLDHVHRPAIKDYPSTKETRKAAYGRVLEAISRQASRDSPLQTKNVKKRVDAGHIKTFSDVSSRIIYRSQGADVSGVTSTMDATSTRTSTEKSREPMPCQGRKELISLVQEALQGPNHGAVSAPASQRKRVAAPPGKLERRLVYLSPMPLHSNGVAVAGAGLLNSKGDRKHRREGPCVGTKGFRAPEVLFKSPHQGPKVDIWSAGVTLLYLMIGRAPFIGNPEQNIKDIAKLRGSEDLWELAKLHNRETSFPADLFDIQSLPSTDLQVWCELHTRRPDFHEMAPWSLFDLVGKCLTVNPRLRISADEALQHEFFAPCHEALRKQRLQKRSLSTESGIHSR